ncbi:hypothetical protein FF38_07964 [Lucilia cuprina]|uniref:Uncharacterized protein n=1 Tax=Lucilia cuprina TaxID=7375 RepID=A0A0L0C2V1_LUCCU|nr:hypothetical protein FF38_07964 [Lucilia cuprina]
MDLILEVADHFVFDKAYATLFPVSTSSTINHMAATASGTVTSSTAEHIVSTIKQELPKYASLVANWTGPKATRYGAAPTYYFPVTEFASQSILLRDNIVRQSLTLFLITTFFGWVLYLGTALFSYLFIYDHDNFNHPKFLKNQVRMEIHRAVTAIPTMTLLTLP